MPKRKEQLNKIYRFLLCALGFVMPLGNSPLNSNIIIVLLLLHIITGNWKENFKHNIANKYVIIFISLYFIYVVGLIHSTDMSVGFRQLEVKLPILVFPLLILTGKAVDKELVSIILKSFLTGVILYTLYLISSVLLKVDELSISSFTHSNLSKYHPSYLSIFVVFSILIIINNLIFSRLQKSIIIFNIIILTYLVVFTIALSSKSAILGLFISCLVYAVVVIKKKRWIMIFLGFLIAAFVTSIVVISQTDSLKERLIDAPLKALKNGKSVDANDQNSWAVSFRLQIWDCALDVLSGTNSIFGYGTGDSREKLRECYKEKQYAWILVRNMNSHSEYLAALLKVGILGLVIMLLCFFYPFFSKQISPENGLYLAFLILVSVMAIAENIFSIHKGVLFYGFYNSLLALNFIRKSE
ncbi:hypothetical protein ATO12_22820 [Aquimarina atlantica]|uniref:O-antigen ligase-related domain-containing protein n=1 Tax=Aquimarina atlantica TaxID=1317122 RepID=A0A023BRA1_9FLAO|nr:O-antigen ligase family protein [Aquimarina atlantica]EZH72288.1 hypothetical protein ATO12_22820 [Aquimarina atlantica]